MGSERRSLGVDRAIAELAERQHGVVARRQLLAIGFTARAIQRRIDAGRLHPLYRGVYAVGHARVSRDGRWLAAVLASGERSVLSHRAAAALWGIRQYTGRAEVTIPRGSRGRAAIVARRSSLQPDEITEVRGIPVTTVARTLLDLAGVLEHEHQLDKAIRQAEYLRLFDLTEVTRLLDRHPRRARALRKAVDTAAAGMQETRSDLEDRFRALLLDADLPTPVLNATIELDGQAIEPDALWPAHKLIVELDGRQTHGTPSAFEADRLRDRRLAAAGYRTIRITSRQLGAAAVEDIGRALRECTPRLSGRPPADVRRG